MELKNQGDGEMGRVMRTSRLRAKGGDKEKPGKCEGMSQRSRDDSEREPQEGGAAEPEAQEMPGGRWGAGAWAVAEIARSGRELLRQGGLRDSGATHQALWRQSQVCCASLWLTHPKKA